MDGSRFVARMSRLTQEQVLAAVPVSVRGTSWFLMLAAVAPIVAMDVITGHRFWPFALGLVAGLLLALLAARVLAARQSCPVQIGLSGILAVSSSTVFLASVRWWSGRPHRIRAAWPRTAVSIEVGAKRRLLVRSVTVRQASGASTALESMSVPAWIDPALTELQRLVHTGAGTGRTVDPWAPTT